MRYHIEQKGSSRDIVVDEPVPYMIDGFVRFVPAGYRSNGFSCPRWAQWLMSPPDDTRTVYAGCVHDWIFDTHFFTRSKADAWMRRTLIQDGYPRWKAWIAWIGVRLWGWRHW